MEVLVRFIRVNPARPMPTPYSQFLACLTVLELNIHLEIQSSSAPEVFSDPVP